MSWSEIKKAINSNIGKPLDEVIGKSTDTGGSTSTGTIMSKLNELISTNSTIYTIVNSLNMRPKVVKSVQRGTLSVSSSSSTYAVSISSVNISKTIVLVNGFTHNAMNNMYHTLGGGYLSNSTTLYIRRSEASHTNADWQVIEFY